MTNITTDLMLFFLPMHVLFQVQRPLKQYVALINNLPLIPPLT